MLYATELIWNGGVGDEDEYQRAINRMGRSTLGVFKSTPLGIVVAESVLTPARALLNHRQAKFTQRLYARPRDGRGPEEILTREGSAFIASLRAVVSLRPGHTVETREWSARRCFPGQIIVEKRAEAVQTASE